MCVCVCGGGGGHHCTQHLGRQVAGRFQPLKDRRATAVYLAAEALREGAAFLAYSPAEAAPVRGEAGGRFHQGQTCWTPHALI